VWSIIIVGLGNPGRTYDRTRHNLGFEVVDRLSERFRCPLQPGKGDYMFGVATLGDRDVCLMKPLTFMNNSGVAVADIMEHFEIPVRKIFVVCDDFQLPLGQLRIRERGSDGGHNGLASVIYHTLSEDFPRLRCGIGIPDRSVDSEEMASFVLSRFEEEEITAVRTMVERAADACVTVIEHGTAQAMNLYNTRLDKS